MSATERTIPTGGMVPPDDAPITVKSLAHSATARPSMRAGPVRTGVTAILPRGKDGVGVPCAAG